MKVLLTGGSGFLGKHINQYFINLNTRVLSSHAHYNVTSLSSDPFDLRDSHACKKALEYFRPDVIVHAAGNVGGILANRENPGKFMYDNLAMGMNMLERTRLYRDKYHSSVKLIMLGTVCSYPKFAPIPFTEGNLWDGYPEETNAPYGIAKKTLMKLGDTYNEQYGMDIVNLIPVNMYGEYDHFNLTSSHVIPALILKFYNAIKNGEKKVTIWGSGEVSREFLHAKDCAKAIHSAIYTQDIGSEPINIGTGKETKIKTLVATIANIMGYTGLVTFDKTKPDGQPRRCLDTTRASDILGFQAKTDLYTGLKQTIKWFMNDNNWKDTE